MRMDEMKPNRNCRYYRNYRNYRSSVKALALVMALVMAFTFTACAPQGGGETYDETNPLIPAGVPTGDLSEVTFDQIEYVHYDYAVFEEYVKQAEKVIEEGDAEKLAEMLDNLQEALWMLGDNYYLAGLARDRDVTQTSWGDEMEYSSEITEKGSLEMAKLLEKAANSEKGDEFAVAWGLKDKNELMESAETFREEAGQTDKEETGYINEYYNTYNELAEKETPEEEDYTGLVKPLISLVNHRNEMAKEEGYDNYAQMKYEEKGTSFLEKQKVFFDAVKTACESHEDLIRINSYELENSMDFEFFSPEEAMNFMDTFLPMVSKELGEYFREINKKGFFILDDGEKCFNTRYTVPLRY